MESSFWSILEPNSVFSDQSISSEGVKISNGMSSSYLWKLIKTEEIYPEQGKTSMLSLIKEYLKNLFLIPKGDNPQVSYLTSNLIKALRRFIRNIKIIDSEFKTYVVEVFNAFHTRVIDLQQDKSLEIMNSVKSYFKFKPVIKKFMVLEKKLDYETNVFLTKVIVMKEYNLENFFSLFIDTFKDFIGDYSKETEETLRDFIEKKLTDFDRESDRYLLEAKRLIESYLFSVVESIRPTRITLLMRELPKQNADTSPWLVCFDKIVDQEMIELNQIVYLTDTHLLITISFLESNRLMIVNNDRHAIDFFESDLYDSSTIICEGSSRDLLIMIHNNLRVVYLAFEIERRLEALKKLENFFTDHLEKVNSAVYNRKNKEICFVDNRGHLRFYKIETEKGTENSDVVPTIYRSIHMSDCNNFILMLGKSESYVFTSAMHLILQDFNVPDLSCIFRRKVMMVKFQPDGLLSIFSVELDTNYTSEINLTDTIKERIGNELRNTISFGADLLEGMLQRNRFISFEPPEIIPK